MENEVEIYSNSAFAKNLETLIDDSSYTISEIVSKMEKYFGIKISEKQIKRYVNGTAIPKANTLCLLATYFDVSVDGLLGRCAIDRIYINDNDDHSCNKFHLDSYSRRTLSKIDNDTKIDVLNKIINSNLLNVFTTQLENATERLENITDKETKENIIFESSGIIQWEIYKLFRKSVNEYMKK